MISTDVEEGMITLPLPKKTASSAGHLVVCDPRYRTPLYRSDLETVLRYVYAGESPRTEMKKGLWSFWTLMNLFGTWKGDTASGELDVRDLLRKPQDAGQQNVQPQRRKHGDAGVGTMDESRHTLRVCRFTSVAIQGFPGMGVGELPERVRSGTRS